MEPCIRRPLHPKQVYKELQKKEDLNFSYLLAKKECVSGEKVGLPSHFCKHLSWTDPREVTHCKKKSHVLKPSKSSWALSWPFCTNFMTSSLREQQRAHATSTGHTTARKAYAKIHRRRGKLPLTLFSACTGLQVGETCTLWKRERSTLGPFSSSYC